MIKNRFFKNTSWILFGQVIKLLITFIIGVITARYLGPSNNGVINYVNSYISFFTSLTGLGLNGIIIHEFVNHNDKEGKILGTAITLRFLTGVISAVAFIGIINWTDGSDKTILAVSFLQSIQLPFLCLDTINYWYQSKMNSKYAVLAQTIAYIAVAAYKIYLLLTRKSVIWFGFAISLDIILLGITYLIFYNKHKTQKLRFDFSIVKSLLRSCLPFILANVMIVIYGHMDRIMIKQLLDNTKDVGLYSAAINVCGIIGFIPAALLDSGRPIIAEAKNQSQEIYTLRFRQLIAGVMWVCIFYSIFITFFSKSIIYLMYGKEYIEANLCTKIVVWYTAFSCVGSAKDFWLICEDKKRYVFIFSAIGTGCNIVMNLLLIPLFGINGAAAATLITQIFTNFIFPFAFKETREYGKCVLDALLLRNIQLKSICDIIKNKIISMHNCKYC